MRDRSSDRFLFYGLLILLVWLPLPMGSNRVWAWAAMEVLLQLLALVWLVLALAGRVSPTPAFRRARPAMILFVLWLGFLAFQIAPLPLAWIDALSPAAADLYRTLPAEHPVAGGYTLSLDPSASLSFLLKSWAYFLLFSLTLLLIRTNSRIKIFVFVIVLSGVFQALFGTFMVLSGMERLLFGPKSVFVGIATGTFVNRNHLAGYLNMCLALGIGWLVAGGRDHRVLYWRQRIRNWLGFLLSGKMRLRLLLVFMAIALVMTHSRMGNTAFFAALLVSGAVWLVIRRRRPRRTAILVLSSILVLDIFVLGHWFGLDQVVDRLRHTSAQVERRDDVVRESLDYAKDYWLTGSGSGSFHSTYPGYMGPGSVVFYRYAHNDYLQFFLETGSVGFVLVSLLVLTAGHCALKAMAIRNHTYLRSLGFGSFMGMLAIMIHSAVDFNLQIPSNAALFVVLLALAWIARGFPGKTSGRAPDPVR